MNLSSEHLTADDEHARIYGEDQERPAPYCHGPGPRMEFDRDGWLVTVEECDECGGRRGLNHWRYRLPEGVDL